MELDEPVQQEAKVVEDRRDDEELAKEDEQAFLNPSRWWFASTAFPLLAGTFGPMASAFSVCALVENWRVIVPSGPGGNEAHGIDVKDPGWLIGVNVVSLVLALTANMALLLNMAQRISFTIAQPITIVGWYIASFLLIALVVTATYSLKLPGENRALTQAFYYAILAAGLYFIISTLMVITVYGAYKEHYPMKFKLTMSQRTLMLQTISFMVYMLAGAAVYYKVEGWKFLDAVYFANYTLLTVGIGDYAPLTHTGRALLFPYAIGGIVTLGLVVGSIRSLVLERGKEKIGRRLIEKKREHLLKKMAKKGENDKLKPIESYEEAKEVGMTEQERRRAEFELMREIQEHVAQRQKWNALLLSGSAWLVLWLVGAAVFWKAEHAQGWSYFGALYFAYTSLLTIGYGDFKPFSNAGKPAFVFWSLLAVPALTIVISNMGDTVVKAVRDLTDYLGEFTLLPGENPTKQRAKQMASRVKKLGTRKNSDEKSHRPPSRIGRLEASSAHTEQIEELESTIKAKHQGTHIIEDLNHYHYLIVKELRKVLVHLNETPPRQYQYHEWAWFLKLMGEDEDNDASHRRAPVKVRREMDEKPDMQQGTTDDAQQETRQWSWLGNRSPLMGETTEAQWVFERLSVTLERELKMQIDRKRQQPQTKGSYGQDGEKAAGSAGSEETLDEAKKRGNGE